MEPCGSFRGPPTTTWLHMAVPPCRMQPVEAFPVGADLQPLAVPAPVVLDGEPGPGECEVHDAHLLSVTVAHPVLRFWRQARESQPDPHLRFGG